LATPLKPFASPESWCGEAYERQEAAMLENMAVKWIAVGNDTPPLGERLLLIFSAAGDPVDEQRIGHSEICLGYWTGERFRATRADYPHSMTVKAAHWARLPRLPAGVTLAPRDEFEPNVRE
jgi:hypothetical protein